MYNGERVNGQPHGKGIWTFADGDVYEGSWENGDMSGHGVMTYANGNIYDGLWQEGLPHGFGRWSYPDSASLEGEWSRGVFTGAHGVLHAPDQSKYEGQLKNGVPYGQGTKHHSDDRVEKGSWKSDHLHGQGELTEPDGSSYIGEFKSGKPHGQGKWTYADGRIIEGEWQEGVLLEPPRVEQRVESKDEIIRPAPPSKRSLATPILPPAPPAKRSLAKPILWFTVIAVIVSGILWVTLSTDGTESISQLEKSVDDLSSTRNSDINGPETSGLVASASTVPEDSNVSVPSEESPNDGTLLDEQLEVDSIRSVSTPANNEVIVQNTIASTQKNAPSADKAPSSSRPDRHASTPVRSSLLASIDGEDLEMLDEHYGFGVNGKRPRWQLGPGYSGNSFVAKGLSGGVLVLTTTELTNNGYLTFWINNWPGQGYWTNIMPQVLSQGRALDVVVIGGSLKEAWTQLRAGPLAPGHHKVTIEFKDGQSRSGMVRDYRVDDIKIWELTP